jgi:hypothetical protein
MEEWNTLVRTLEDEYKSPKQFQDLAKEIFQWMVTHKIKDMRKFEQRVGVEYEQLLESLKYPGPMIKDILDNDDFFFLTIKLQKKYKR